MNNKKTYEQKMQELNNQIDYFINTSPEKAIAKVPEVTALLKKLPNKKEGARALRRIGWAYLCMGNITEALDYSLKSLSLFEEMNDTPGIADCLNNLGCIYEKYNDYESARSYYGRALSMYEESRNRKGQAGCYNNIGFMHDRFGEYDKAIAHYQKALELYIFLGDNMGVAVCYNNIGCVYENYKDYDKALKYYQKALAADVDQEDKIGYIDTLNGIGSLFIKTKEYDKAEEYLQRAFTIAAEVKAKKLMSDTYRIFSDLYLAQENHKRALEYFKLHADTKDSIINEETKIKIVEMQTKYELEKKEREKEIYRLKNVELVHVNQKIKKANEVIKRKNVELTEAYKKLEQQAKTDRLTMVSNRWDMLEKIEWEVATSKEKEKPFSLVLVDIDNFKKFNDVYGHACGDYVLIQAAKLMKSMIRGSDHIARWGGEEFLLLLPDTEIQVGGDVAERIRQKVSSTRFEFQGQELSITMTFGVSAYDGFMDVDACIKKADYAMYTGKNLGRNCVVLAPEEDMKVAVNSYIK